MPKMDLGQLGFIYSTCEPFKKNKELKQKFKEAEDLWCIYHNELDKGFAKNKALLRLYKK